MKVDCAACPLRSKPAFAAMSEDEVRFMKGFKAGEMEVAPGTVILLEGSASPQLFTVFEGMGLRYIVLPNGRRQVLNFLFPGDFIGLQSSLLGEMTHSVEATTPMRLCVFDRRSLWRLYRDEPSRAYDLTWITAASEHFMGAALATVGQLDAEGRIAWALCRIFRRMELLDLVEDSTCRLPYRQQDLADALGLSLVHTNKTLGRFRERGLATWTGGRLKILDARRLADLAMIETSEHEPRPLM